jgi:phage shock protein PspC (stress-responsive transcriptional regulator)
MEIIERILAVIGLFTTVGFLISAYFIRENLK